ncbi:hypothetical protein ACP4OV_015091 [Aristida adscensionis]
MRRVRLIRTAAMSDVCKALIATILLPFRFMFYVPVLVYGYGGRVACTALALWRIMQRDYSSKDNGNLTPALDLFYSLVLFQGAIYLIWLFCDFMGIIVLQDARQHFSLPETGWSHKALVDYLFNTRARCLQDPASIHGRTLLNFAVDLLDSGSWEDNLSGARFLHLFIRQGADIRSLLLPSRPKIQKLVDALGWRHLQQAEAREMRKHAAHIVAHLASDIHLARFPGAIQCIASLLQDETTRTYWNSNQLGRLPCQSQPPPLKQARIRWLHTAEIIYKEVNDIDTVQQKTQGNDQEGGDCCNELILQGLTILERLASDPHNCRDICSVPGLLPKIMAPIYFNTLIQDIKNSDWANVLNGSFKVLNCLMCAPGEISRRLCREISTNTQAVSNLEGILDHGNEAGEELLMRAMEILTELALDISVNLAMETKQKLMKKQLQIFTTDEGVETAAGMSNQLRATAGRTLALLTTSSETNSTFIMTEYDGIVAHLTEMLGANNNTTYRTIAADILENLCSHGELNQEHVKETLIPVVLAEALPSKRDLPQSNNSAPGSDEENQLVSAQRNDEVSHSVSLQVDSTKMQELSSAEGQHKSSEDGHQTAAKDLQEAILSLMLVICDNSPDDFDKVVEEKLGRSTFVAKLKMTVEENCNATTAGSLRIVKFCGQIAISIMQRNNQYMEHFKNKKFIKSLSESSKIMSNLESCVLYAGTDFRLKKAVRPLLIDIEEKAGLLVG